MTTTTLSEPTVTSELHSASDFSSDRPSPQPSTPNASRATWTSWSLVLACGWLGITTGGIEGLYWTAHQWSTGGMVFMHPGYLWISPLTQGFLCLALGLLTALVAKIVSKGGWQKASLFVVTAWSWLNLVQLWIPGLQVWAWLLLGCGFASATIRLIEQRVASFRRVVMWSLPPVALLIGCVAGSSFVSGKLPGDRHDPSATTAAIDGERPNVLLIVLDTVRADAVTSESTLTPHINAFASRGIQFTSAKATAPWTLPSQAGMFTGRLPHELSSDWWSRLDDTFPTLAECLGKQGWRTGGFVANTRYCSRETGLDRGFDRYEAYRWSWADSLITTAIGRKILMSPLPTYVGLNDWPGRKRASEVNDAFLDWVDERESNQPFFAFLNYWDAHDPYFAPEEFQSQSVPTGKDLMLLRDWWWTHKDDLTDAQLKMLRTAYEDCIRALDAQIEVLLEALEQRGILDNTLVMITADHGEHFGDHDLYLHGNSLYDAVLGVPLKLVWPKRLAPQVIDSPVSLRDLPATVTALLDIDSEFPGQPWAVGDVNAGGDMEQPVISEIASQAGFPPCHGRSPVAAGPMQSVQQGSWKYIRDALGNEWLFDLGEDPNELRNLAADSAWADKKERLLQTLRAENPGGALSPWPAVPKLEDDERSE